LNHDGIADFTFRLPFASGQYAAAALKVALAGENAIWGSAKDASALPAGVRIGPSKNFQLKDLAHSQNLNLLFSRFCTE
jgi:hypothetical protein